MNVNHKSKDDRATTLESLPKGAGKRNSSISSLDEFELTKDEARFECSSTLSITEMSVSKELVKMTKEEGLDANSRTSLNVGTCSHANNDIKQSNLYLSQLGVSCVLHKYNISFVNGIAKSRTSRGVVVLSNIFGNSSKIVH